MPWSGLTSQWRPPSLATTYSSSRVTVAPTAVPRQTPMRSVSSASVRSPLSASASAAAASANWANRPLRRISRG